MSLTETQTDAGLLAVGSDTVTQGGADTSVKSSPFDASSTDCGATARSSTAAVNASAGGVACTARSEGATL